ncbi:MAG: imidazole glycerol phosphate synthase subunit HisH [Muribaculaceae bacterium]|nr:imidazole glycerol phosphate synthase subunit HisH [Muribaculaceae bacterium]MDD6869404.1 imidazole glycerol phosphate synthase subunit HisH [bacterium]MDY5828218.1 imidazole glycerol phosphate synthase subunit HisH [Candidatus Limisoma sp.]
MKVAILKYNAGNVFSVDCALRRLGVEPIVTDNVEQLRRADKVVFPGVGEASSAMAYLRSRHLDELIRSLTQPVIGICIGQQLLCRNSEEGNTECIGVFDTSVKRFSEAPGVKVPEMGWNTIKPLVDNPLLKGIDENSYVYYVHSYYVPVCDDTIAVTDYSLPFSAAMNKDNFYATQFHPEKSGGVGELILKNFLIL